jgi:hypothetical protein
MSRVPDFFFRGVAATFPSPLPPEEAAARLATATHRQLLPPLFRQCVVGRVSVSGVILYRHRPFFRNSVTPCFRGHFLARATGCVLKGHFVVHWSTKLFLLLWYGLLAYIAAGALGPFALSARDANELALFALVALGFAMFPVLLVIMGMALGKSDADYISRVIHDCIGEHGA